MAVSLKTIEYWFPMLATAADAADTDLTQITVHIPESSLTFRSVTLHVMGHDPQTTLGNLSRRQLSLRLGAAAYTVVNNTQLFTNSGEQYCWMASADFTAHFTANWTGASMTCDARVLVDSSTASALAQRDISAKLTITYAYEDTSATHVSTVWIPLNAPVGALATTKPGTATDTIPALDTYLPEAGKTYRNVAIVVQGNTATVGTVDHSLSIEIDTLGVQTTGLIEAAANTDMWMRYAFDVTGDFTTNATHGFYIWGSVAKWNHAQVWMVVTYTWTLSGTTSLMRSLLLPMDFASPAGGTASTQAQRASRELWVQEPATITLQRLALFLFWDQAAAVSGLNARVGTGSYVTYTDTAATLAGGNGLMIRNDAGASLARGRNSLQADVYCTDTTDLMFNLSGFWMVNYTCGVPTNGVGAANRTVVWNLATVGTSAAAAVRDIAAVAPVIPATNYFVTAVGTNYQYLTNSTGTAAGVTVLVERLTAEGGVQWEPAYVDIGYTDPEAGVHNTWSQVRSIFRRWTGDPDTDRLDIETARRWRCVLGNNCASFDYLDLYITYHAITYTVADSVTGFSGTVTLDVHRADSGERVLTGSRSGDGAFSFVWFDNTEELYVSANDGTNQGRSADALATGSP